MLDQRIKTFLELCNTMNYTRAAETLRMTQPAVTQHIKFLENEYGCKLFTYQGKVLYLTEKGKKLLTYAQTMNYNEKQINASMMETQNSGKNIKIGATKTIGEFVIANKVAEYLKEEQNDITVMVNNTKVLLKELEAGNLDYAMVEGFFDKLKYDYKLMRKEEFVGICSKGHPFSNKKVSFQDIINEKVIVREKGSGTRDIFEQMLKENNFTLESIKKIITISNFNLIKELVKSDCGISLVYKAVFDSDSQLGMFKIEGGNIFREFNYVYLKGKLV